MYANFILSEILNEIKINIDQIVFNCMSYVLRWSLILTYVINHKQEAHG